MKKYKHKITGNIAVETNSEKNYKVSKPKNFNIPKWVVEDSNDWEEVIEYNFEIISFIRKGVTTTFSMPFDMHELNDFLLDEYEIYSIRRTCDNKVFTLSDKIVWDWIDCDGNKYLTIENFILKENEIKFSFKEIGGMHNCIKYPKLTYYKNSLFTTEDGYEIYDGVHTDLKTYRVTNSWDIITSFSKSLYNKSKLFKLKENAEKYIEENKPTYNKKQMLDFAKYYRTKTYMFERDVFNNWKLKYEDK